MTLQMSSTDRQKILTHAESTYPEECCGLLLGKLGRASQTPNLLVEVRQIENQWQSELADELKDLIPDASSGEPLTKSKFYWIDPKEMLTAQRYARERGLDIIGIYHSHPDHPAVPSEHDRILAWSQYSYMIVSVEQGVFRDIRCWKLDSSHQFQPEEMVAIGSSAEFSAQE
jgi:proteasome lid subunit RPN8/RPN11